MSNPPRGTPEPEGSLTGNGRPLESVQQDVDRWQVRRLAVRVLVVQVVALLGLWALQSWFGRP